MSDQTVLDKINHAMTPPGTIDLIQGIAKLRQQIGCGATFVFHSHEIRLSITKSGLLEKLKFNTTGPMDNFFSAISRIPPMAGCYERDDRSITIKATPSPLDSSGGIVEKYEALMLYLVSEVPQRDRLQKEWSLDYHRQCVEDLMKSLARGDA